MDAGSDLPPPVQAPARGTSARSLGRSGPTRSVLPWIVGVVVLLVVGSAVVLFSAGEALFGSDSGTIDSDNRDTLDSCQVPAGSTLVQVPVRGGMDGSGQRYRSMGYVYASPWSADDVAQFFGVGVGQSTVVSSQRACRYGQRPPVLVLSESVAGEPSTGAVPPVGGPVVVPAPTCAARGRGHLLICER